MGIRSESAPPRAPSFLRRLAKRLPTHAGAAVLFLAAVLALLWPVLLGGRALSPASLLYFTPPWTTAKPADVTSDFNVVLSDIPTVYYPWWSYAREALHAGTLPEWNPHALAGTPFFANPQSALLSPFSLPLWVLPFHYAFGVVGALQLWLTAFGTYLLARELRLGFAPALLAGLAFGFSAFAVVWLTYPLMGVIAMLPWALWLAERIIRRGLALDALLLTLVLAAALLAGHPGTQVHVYAVLAAYGGLRLLLEAGRGALLRRALLLAVPLALALALSAVVLLPVALTIPGTVGLEVRSSGGLTLPDAAMRTLFFPDWWGRPSDVYLQSPVNYNEGAIYAGTAVLLLAALALLSSDRWRAKMPFAVLGVIGFQAAFALEPVSSLLAHTPVLRSDRNARLSVLVQLAAAMLAAFALERLLTDRKMFGRITIVGAAALLVGLGGLAVADPSFHELRVVGNHFRTGTDYAIADVVQTVSVAWWLLLAAALTLTLIVLRPRLTCTTLAALVVALVAVDLAHFARGYNPMPPDERAFPATPAAVQFLQQRAGNERVAAVGITFPPDTSTVYGLRDVRGNDPPMPELRYFRVFRLVNPSQSPGDWLSIPALDARGRRILDMLAVRWLMFPPGSTAPAFPGIKAAYRGADADVYRNNHALGRAYLPESVTYSASENETLAAIASPDFDVRREAFVEGARAKAAEGTVRVLRDEPSTIVVTAELEKSGLLVVSESFDEGWTVTIDGRDADPLRVNSVLRGVAVPAGKHTVRWSYRTPGLVAGAAITGAGVLAVAIWGAALMVRRGRRRAARASRGL